MAAPGEGRKPLVLRGAADPGEGRKPLVLCGAADSGGSESLLLCAALDPAPDACDALADVPPECVQAASDALNTQVITTALAR